MNEPIDLTQANLVRSVCNTPAMIDHSTLDSVAADVRFSGVLRVDVHGQAPLQRAYGLAHRGFAVANTLDTQFGVASATKGLTALMIMSLVESGHLSLDTTARSLLGADLPLIDDSVTVEHLLSHRSGIGDYLDEDELSDNNSYVMRVPVHRLARTEQFVVALDGFPHKHAPDTTFAYCNSGFVVLALLAERATGMEYHDLVEQRVCAPAGMRDTEFLRSDQLPSRAAIGYLDDDGLRSNVLHLPVRGNGDGGVYTTVDDVQRLWHALFAGQIVTPTTVADMLTARSDVPDMGMQYGLGFWLESATDSVILIGGDAGVGFFATYCRDGSFATTVLCNQTRGTWPASERLRQLQPGR
jgi:CubicO group peptidase (beta-lactamase class C family)